MNLTLRRAINIAPMVRTFAAPQQRFFHKSLPAQSELVKKDDIGEMLGKAHGNVEFVVSKVDDLVNWARKGYEISSSIYFSPSFLPFFPSFFFFSVSPPS